jgi:uncharacterized protein (TIGR03085 family)
MAAKDVLRAERAALCDTFERLGPDAPTLCEGWTTADLAAHLVARERDPRGMPGIVLGGPFARYTTKLRERQKAKGYDVLLQRLRSGPPALMVATMPAADVNENWIHHEDARRANGEGPRPEDPATAAVMVGLIKRVGGLQTRGLKPFGIELELPDGSRVVLRKAPRSVVLRGPVGESALYLAGRREAAHVELDGDAEAQELLRTIKMGI